LSQEFEGKVAIVTGGAGGIGRATAVAFARKGARVVVADVDTPGGQETVEMIETEGGQALFVETDVSDSDDVQKMVQQTIDAYGRLDIAFNNAGIEGEQAPTAEGSEDNWDRVIDINLKGVWLCMREEIPHMFEQGGGAIVNMSSVAGRVGFENLPAYVASKHGVLGLTKTAALEYATQDVRVNAVCPGVIHTEMIDRVTGGDEEMLEAYAKMAPVERMGEPQEVADAVVWLCSRKASFVTGHALTVDGGYVVA
jgi:NAD(P)-dependent dehydrogenase (short-subunit alcohol dehydrogenase family)